jgi:glycosyltransferase involved in cell wall biosynthesis
MMRMKKIAIFLPNLFGGGVQHIMIVLAKEFSRIGYEVHLVLVKAEGPYLSRLTPEIKVWDIRNNEFLAGTDYNPNHVANLKAFAMLKALPGLIRYIVKNKPDVLLSAMSFVNVIAVLAKWFSRQSIRVVLSERNNFSMAKKLVLKWKAPFIQFLMKITYPKADAIIAISKGVADDLAKNLSLNPEKITVVYNPCDVDEVLNKAKEEIDHTWFNNKEIPVIVAIGRLAPQKDFMTLIKAFAQIVKQRKARLVILGEGYLRKQLELEINTLGIEQWVDLHGFVNNPYPYMNSADLFVLSSRYEGFGNVVVESLALGVPVVSTECPSGPAEILENGKWGYLVPVGNTNALSGAILRALNQPINNGIQLRANDFSIEKAITGYLKALFPDDKIPEV